MGRIFCGAKNSPYLCTRNPDKGYAQMAESVDALVSNTSGATHPGSTPGLGTKESFPFWKALFFVNVWIIFFIRYSCLSYFRKYYIYTTI